MLIQAAAVAIVVGNWLYISGGEELIKVNSQPVSGSCELLVFF